MQPTGKKLEDMETNDLVEMRAQVDMVLERRRREDILTNGGFICRDCGTVVARSYVINARGDIAVEMDKRHICLECYGKRRAVASQNMIERIIGEDLKLESASCLRYEPDYVHASKLVFLHPELACRFVVTRGMESSIADMNSVSIGIRPYTGDII